MEQLLGFHVVSPDLTSHLPQPLRSSSFRSPRASVCWRASGGAAPTSERKDAAKSSAENLGKGPARFGQGCGTAKSFGSVPMKWRCSAASPRNSI